MDALRELYPSLASIVAPVGVNHYLEHFWKQKVFYCQGSPQRLGLMLRELGSADIAGLVWQSMHCAVLHSRPHEHYPARASISAALEAYDKRGATLYFRMKDDWPLAKWTSALAEELGELPIGVTSFFATRSGNSPNFSLVGNASVNL